MNQNNITPVNRASNMEREPGYSLRVMNTTYLAAISDREASNSSVFESNITILRTAKRKRDVSSQEVCSEETKTKRIKDFSWDEALTSLPWEEAVKERAILKGLKGIRRKYLPRRDKSAVMNRNTAEIRPCDDENGKKKHPFLIGVEAGPNVSRAIESIFGHAVPEFEHLPLGDLDNKIDPLLSKGFWKNISDELYDAIAPALKLVSLWITEEKTSGWFAHTATGHVQEGQNGKTYLAHSADSCGRKGIMKVKKVFKNLLKIIEFGFLSDAEPELNADAQTRFPLIDVVDGKPQFGITIVIAQKVRRHLEGPFATESPAKQLNFQFLLALMILHEIGHAFFKAAHGFEHVYEPFHTSDSWYAEMGWSCETTLSGLFLMSPPRDISAPFVKSMTPVSTVDNDVGFRVDNSFFITPPGWIRAWFLKSNWERIRVCGHQIMHHDLRRLRFSTGQSSLCDKSKILTLKLDGTPLRSLIIRDERDEVIYQEGRMPSVNPKFFYII